MHAAVVLMLLAGAELRLELPLDDTPFNQRHGFELSMEQSAALNLDVTLLGDWLIDKGLERAFRGKPGWARLLVFIPATFAWVLLLSLVPPGLAWTHEEWHRAVLTANGVHSRNGIYTSPPLSPTIAVDHVTDAELAAFKARSPDGFVRMSSAGLEAQTELNRRIERGWFFDDRSPFRDHAAIGWSVINSFVYLGTCAGPSSDQLVDDANAHESDVQQRDFTGADCTSWAYDLEHPNEPYAARGVHPLGNGINRYRSWRDLSPQAQSFLQAAWWLTLLNLVTPGWGVSSLPGVNGTRWSFGVFHQLTSFGQTVDVELYFRIPRAGQFLAVLHGGFGLSSFQPGLEVGIVRAAIADDVRLSVTLMGWLQQQAGGLLRVRADWHALEHGYLFAEGLAKTQGFVSGVVWLGPALEARFGIGALL